MAVPTDPPLNAVVVVQNEVQTRSIITTVAGRVVQRGYREDPKQNNRAKNGLPLVQRTADSNVGHTAACNNLLSIPRNLTKTEEKKTSIDTERKNDMPRNLPKAPPVFVSEWRVSPYYHLYQNIVSATNLVYPEQSCFRAASGCLNPAGVHQGVS